MDLVKCAKYHGLKENQMREFKRRRKKGYNEAYIAEENDINRTHVQA